MGHRFQSIYAYLGAGFLLAIVAVAAITVVSANRQDEESLFAQQVVAESAVDQIYQNLRGQIASMVYWQDTFDKTVRSWDTAWISYQFGTYQSSTGDNSVAIVGPDGGLRFLHFGRGAKLLNKAAVTHAATFKTLIAAMRRLPVSQPPPSQQGVISLAGKAYFALAMTVTPEQAGDLEIARQRPNTVVFFAPILPDQFAGLHKGFGASQITITARPASADGIINHPLRDVSGRPIAYVLWKPVLPAAEFWRFVLVPVIFILFLLALVQVLVMVRWLNMQSQLIQTEAKAASAQAESRIKSVFLGNLSHELRTPLNAIIGFAELMGHEMFGPLGSPKYSAYVSDIMASGKQLLKTVNDLIEIARIEARDTGLEREHVDASECAARAIETANAWAVPKNVKLNLQTPEAGVFCDGSALSLTLAIERILNNAVRHSREQGKVCVTVAQHNDTVFISIRDHGDGIAEDRLERLTSPFGNSNNHLVASGTSPGFGVPIAKGLVQLMGGTFSIESAAGKGTTVCFRLPASTPAQTAAEQMAA